MEPSSEEGGRKLSKDEFDAALQRLFRDKTALRDDQRDAAQALVGHVWTNKDGQAFRLAGCPASLLARLEECTTPPPGDLELAELLCSIVVKASDRRVGGRDMFRPRMTHGVLGRHTGAAAAQQRAQPSNNGQIHLHGAGLALGLSRGPGGRLGPSLPGPLMHPRKR